MGEEGPEPHLAGLAAVRQEVGELPLELRLGDAASAEAVLDPPQRAVEPVVAQDLAQGEVRRARAGCTSSSRRRALAGVGSDGAAVQRLAGWRSWR